MFMYLHKKGQSTLEYAVVIAVVVGALLAMQVYIKRGIQGKLRQSSDDIGEQFSPGYTTGTYVTYSNINSTEDISGGTNSTTNTISGQYQNRTSNEIVMNFSNEYWGAP